MKSAVITLFILTTLSLQPLFGAEVQETVELLEPKSASHLFGLDIEYSSNYIPNLAVTSDRNMSSRASAARIAFEVLVLKSVGKLGLGVAGGFFRRPNIEVGTEEWISVYGIPVEANLSYRFDYSQTQWLVPFAQIGATGVWIGQTSKSVNVPDGMQHNYGWTVGGGLELNIGAIERRAARKLEAFFGIDATYLTVSYSKTSLLGNRTAPDISGDNFRAGIRFEM